MAGLLPETPLGGVVEIRAEKDPKIIQKFGPHEKKIRAQWNAFRSRKAVAIMDPAAWEKEIGKLQEMLCTMFGGGGK